MLMAAPSSAARQLTYALPTSANASIEVIEQRDDDNEHISRRVDAPPPARPPRSGTATQPATSSWAATAQYYAPTSASSSTQPHQQQHLARANNDAAADYGSTNRPQPPPPASMDDRVAERILDTLRSKDACIAELERSVEYLTMENARLKTELEDVTMTKETLIVQYGDVMQDLRDMEHVVTERDAAQRQAASYAGALDDANKALALQLEALNEQVKRSDDSEAARKMAQDESRALEGRVASLTHKNHKLLEELRQLASESDANETQHLATLQEAHDAIAALRLEVDVLSKVAESKRHLEVELAFTKTALNERQEALDVARGDLQAAKSALDDASATRDRSQAHVSAHREALASSDRSLQHTEAVAHNAAVELDALRADHAALQATAEDLAAQAASLERARVSLQSELDDAVRVSQEWQQRCDEARRDAARLHDALEASTATFEAKAIQWQQELDICNHQLTTQQTILTTRRELEATMTEEREEQSRNLEDLEDTVEAAQHSTRKWRARFRALEAAHARLCEELRSTHVVHAAECRDLQELASAVAAGQSKQLTQMTNSQEVVVQRLIAAEEEVARLTERCGVFEQTLRLREEDVAHFSNQHVSELKRGQVLSVIAAEKERQDAELVELRGRIVPALEQRIAEMATKLDTVQRRYANLKEKVAVDSVHVSRAKSLEAEAHISTQALESKVAALETTLNAKREGLRAALDERNRLLATIDEGKRELAAMHNRLRTVQKQAEDRERTCEVRVEQAEAAVRQHATELAALEHAHETRIATGVRHVAGALVAAFRVLVEKRISRNASDHDRHRRASEMVNKLLDKYQRDVDVLQGALADTRLRWRNETARADALREEALRLRHGIDALRRGRNAPEGTAAATAKTATSMPNVSQELRSACHNISLEVLGLAGGLDELVALQQQAAAGPANDNRVEDWHRAGGGAANLDKQQVAGPTPTAADRGISLSPMQGEDGAPADAWKTLLADMSRRGEDHSVLSSAWDNVADRQNAVTQPADDAVAALTEEAEMHRRNVAELQLISFDRSSLAAVLSNALKKVFEVHQNSGPAASGSGMGHPDGAARAASVPPSKGCSMCRDTGTPDLHSEHKGRGGDDAMMTATERVRMLLFGTTMPSDGEGPHEQRRPSSSVRDEATKLYAASVQHHVSHQPLQTTLISLADVLS